MIALNAVFAGESYIVLDRREEDGRVLDLRLNSGGVGGWYDAQGLLVRYALQDETEAGKRKMWPTAG